MDYNKKSMDNICAHYWVGQNDVKEIYLGSTVTDDWKRSTAAWNHIEIFVDYIQSWCDLL